MKQMLIVFVLLIPLTFLVTGCGRSAQKEPPPQRTPEEMLKDLQSVNPPLPGVPRPPAAQKK